MVTVTEIIDVVTGYMDVTRRVTNPDSIKLKPGQSWMTFPSDREATTSPTERIRKSTMLPNESVTTENESTTVATTETTI
jgi:hypothetical protein